MAAREIACQRDALPDVIAPSHFANGCVELLCRLRIKLRELQKNAIRHPRPEASPIGGLQSPLESRAGRALPNLRGAECGELANEQIRETARRAGHELHRRAHAASRSADKWTMRNRD